MRERKRLRMLQMASAYALNRSDISLEQNTEFSAK